MTVGAVPDGFILSLQIIASGMMGADYFFDPDQRENINIWINRKAKNFQLRAESNWKLSYQEIFVNNRTKLAITLFLFIASLGMMFSQEYIVRKFGLLGIVVPATGIFLFIFSVAVFSKNVSNHIFSAMISLFFWITSFFVSYCKKGAIFGVGFLFLLFSFLCRYLNLP